MLHCVALVKTGVYEKHITSIIWVTGSSELRTTLAVTNNWNTLHAADDGGDTYLQDVGSYKSHMA
jgi:hypothetical protein